MILNKIAAHKEKEVKEAKKEESKAQLKQKISQIETARDFQGSLAREGIGLISEVKKASPSKGVIKEDFRPVETALEYQQAGADAVSVLTDREFFQGSLEYISEIKREVDLPILRKDFIIDPYQLYKARAYGADAVLLIGAILESGAANYYLQLAHELGLDVLFEVHNREELKTALDIEADIIGINNRDLTNFEVDLQTTIQLQKEVPADKLLISESGIKTRSDIELLAENGIDGVLIGESLMRAEDIQKKIEKLFRM